MTQPASFIGNRVITPIENFRKKIYAILIAERNSHPIGRIFNFVIVTLIVLNVIAVIIQTVQDIYVSYKDFFYTFELYTLVIFSIEYFLQLWICTSMPKYKKPFLGRIKFMLSPMAIVELLVILPFLVSLVTPYDIRFLTIFRIITILRIFKLDKYAEALATFKHIILDKKEELIVTLFGLVMLLIITSSSMYLIERGQNPNFSSIPATMWWAIATLTTVGYGDIFPFTPLGKFLGSIIAVIGIAMFAIPAGLISSSFTEHLQNKRGKKSCPHCGKTI